MPPVSIDRDAFIQAFGRDKQFHEDCPQSTYLDRNTGSIIWVFDSDADARFSGIPEADNTAMRGAVQSEPDRYLHLPARHHGERHEILKAFLDSPWTDDPAEQQRVKVAYFGSIGGWKKQVEEEVWHVYVEYERTHILDLGADFLSHHNVDFRWQ